MHLQIPPELLSDILTYSLDAHPCPSDVLCAHSHLHALGTRVLYSRLHFRSVRQLSLFSQGTAPLPCTTRELFVTLSGGTADFDTFRYLGDAIRRCLSAGAERGEQASRLALELLFLRLNSHMSNPNLPDIYSALCLVNPKTFVWLGPDPGHHFSTAIVPTATYHLFQAMTTWDDVEHIKITNIAFPYWHPNSSFTHNPLLPTMPSLRSLYLGQATLLREAAIAAMVCLASQPRLEQVRLVDTYGESIWGRRIRRADVEKAVADIGLDEAELAAAIEKIRRIIRCEAQNERVIGGDRAEGLVVLE